MVVVRYTLAHTPSLDLDPCGLATRADNAAGYDKVEFLKTRLARIAM